MKLAFSTLGCPDWTWDEIFATAKDMGIDGIEIRGIGREMYAPNIPILTAEGAEATKVRMERAGMEISMLTSGVVLSAQDEQSTLREVRDYIVTAARMNVPYIRVLVSPSVQPEQADLDRVHRLYSQLCGEAAQVGVSLLLETNGALADSTAMAHFMQSVATEGAGVLWDLHHPYRFCGESPETTYKNIGQYVKYMHVKDSVMHEGAVQYRMMGHGDVPVFDALSIMKQHDYRGFISLEWVKRWNNELQEPGLVFYHYGTYMEYLMEQL